MRLLGGEFEAGSVAGGGFAVVVGVPLVQAEPGVLRRVPGAGVSRLPRLASGAAGLVAVGALLLVGLRLAYVPQPSPEAEYVPDVRLGMSWDRVVSLVGVDSPLAHAAAGGRMPAPDPVARCVMPYRSTIDGSGWIELVRYCFINNQLTDIDRFKVSSR
ncbi:hypothetical protein ACIQWR_39910 [Streptomyces sp. NPDC098789]|uniref:hypothetical protein n=1 Tax=Streptomyces sp. NPDC098789 TaxID=3366098 RepID=UPI00381F0AF3